MAARSPYLNSFNYNNNSNGHHSPNNTNNRFAAAAAATESREGRRLTQLFSSHYPQSLSTQRHDMASSYKPYSFDSSNPMVQYHRQLSTRPFFYPSHSLHNHSYQQQNLVSCIPSNSAQMSVRQSHQMSLANSMPNTTNIPAIDLSKKQQQQLSSEFMYWNTGDIQEQQQQSSIKNGTLTLLQTDIKEEAFEPMIDDGSEEELVLNEQEIIKKKSKNQIKTESLETSVDEIDLTGILKQQQQQQIEPTKDIQNDLGNLSNYQKVIQQQDEQAERNSSTSTPMKSINNGSQLKKKQDLVKKGTSKVFNIFDCLIPQAIAKKMSFSCLFKINH
ncbi:unnamed protein product [Didymodactylos carnosus]|uniref:Uncharacterized protein n=1 Tax=Didymodactylos carnosus TaxID=1234261 RepID=A0A813TGL6_9BILA|nr:unnamed protein product [Didymodactylos carnosus]CAF0849374.1 unnamed protein product [Didymodactylos carnosus]CAF3600187.1 unnamed protein product [Didymodactylos carnosus]CAF3634627.1 unnamed protein product [Didymodactylos carnosus]